MDTGQVTGIVDGRDHNGVGNDCWRDLWSGGWRCRFVAINPYAAFHKGAAGVASTPGGRG
jgi:hypothetical protein